MLKTTLIFLIPTCVVIILSVLIYKYWQQCHFKNGVTVSFERASCVNNSVRMESQTRELLYFHDANNYIGQERFNLIGNEFFVGTSFRIFWKINGINGQFDSTDKNKAIICARYLPEWNKICVVHTGSNVLLIDPKTSHVEVICPNPNHFFVLGSFLNDTKLVLYGFPMGTNNKYILSELNLETKKYEYVDFLFPIMKLYSTVEDCSCAIDDKYLYQIKNLSVVNSEEIGTLQDFRFCGRWADGTSVLSYLDNNSRTMNIKWSNILIRTNSLSCYASIFNIPS